MGVLYNTIAYWRVLHHPPASHPNPKLCNAHLLRLPPLQIFTWHREYASRRNPRSQRGSWLRGWVYSSAERELVLAVSTAAGALALTRGAWAPHHHGGGPWDMDKLTTALGATAGGLLSQGPDLFS